MSIGIIGGADGPTAVLVTSQTSWLSPVACALLTAVILVIVAAVVAVILLKKK